MTGEAERDEALVREVLDLTMGLMRAMQGHFGEQIEASGVPAPEIMTMWQLRENGAMPMRAIAACMHLDPSQVTTLVDRLESRGFAERRQHPEDRRVKLVGLTGDGDAFLADMWDRLPEGAPGLSALSVAELRQLRALLRKAVPQAAPASSSLP